MGNYLTILPLIALLLLDFLNSNLGPQLRESNAPKWLGEDVPELSSSLDILELDVSSIDTVTDEVIFDVNVLAPVVVDGILSRQHIRCKPTSPCKLCKLQSGPPDQHPRMGGRRGGRGDLQISACPWIG